MNDIYCSLHKKSKAKRSEAMKSALEYFTLAPILKIILNVSYSITAYLVPQYMQPKNKY